MLTRTLIVLATLTALTACGSLQEPGSPKQSFSIQEDIVNIQSVSAFHVTIEDYYCIGKPQPCGVIPAATAISGRPPSLAAPTPVPVPATSGAIPNNANQKEQQKQFRNKFIAFRLVTINLHYVEFVREVAVNKAQLDTALDVLNLGLTLSSTVVGGPATAAILSAAAAGVAGARISYDKNFFFEKTVAVLVTAMNAQRKTALVPIMKGIGKSIDDYPFERAITDLHIYFESGTFNGALQAIQKDAGIKEATQDEILAILADQTFGEDDNTVLLVKWLGWDGTAYTNKINIAALRSWKTLNKIKDVTVTSFLRAEEWSKHRSKVVEQLEIM